MVFDANFNLYAFGLGEKDFALGTQNTWTSGTANDITATGRPPFDGTNTTCYLTQFFNAVYVMNGDKSNPTDVGIYDFGAKSWTTQKTGLGSTSTGGVFDYSNFDAILDHDTNVFYALSGSNFWDLDFGQMKAANSSPINWNFVGTPSFTTTGYNPVMALAQNHIHFLNVPGALPGSAQVFVIHFSFFQPTPQSFPINGSSNNFPETHGQATSFFQTAGVQQEFAFIPDDGSQTYVINVENNSTATLSGPSDKSSSTFTAGITSLVQLTSAGNIFFLPYTQGDASANSGAKWTQVKLSGLPPPGTVTSPSGSGSASAGASKTSGAGSAPTKSGTASQAGSAVKVFGTSGASLVRSLGVVGFFAAIGFLF